MVSAELNDGQPELPGEENLRSFNSGSNASITLEEAVVACKPIWGVLIKHYYRLQWWKNASCRSNFLLLAARAGPVTHTKMTPPPSSRGFASPSVDRPFPLPFFFRFLTWRGDGHLLMSLQNFTPRGVTATQLPVRMCSPASPALPEKGSEHFYWPWNQGLTSQEKGCSNELITLQPKNASHGRAGSFAPKLHQKVFGLWKNRQWRKIPEVHRQDCAVLGIIQKTSDILECCTVISKS